MRNFGQQTADWGTIATGILSTADDLQEVKDVARSMSDREWVNALGTGRLSNDAILLALGNTRSANVRNGVLEALLCSGDMRAVPLFAGMTPRERGVFVCASYLTRSIDVWGAERVLPESAQVVAGALVEHMRADEKPLFLAHNPWAKGLVGVECFKHVKNTSLVEQLVQKIDWNDKESVQAVEYAKRTELLCCLVQHGNGVMVEAAFDRLAKWPRLQTKMAWKVLRKSGLGQDVYQRAAQVLVDSGGTGDLRRRILAVAALWLDVSGGSSLVKAAEAWKHGIGNAEDLRKLANAGLFREAMVAARTPEALVNCWRKHAAPQRRIGYGQAMARPLVRVPEFWEIFVKNPNAAKGLRGCRGMRSFDTYVVRDQWRIGHVKVPVEVLAELDMSDVTNWGTMGAYILEQLNGSGARASFAHLGKDWSGTVAELIETCNCVN